MKKLPISLSLTISIALAAAAFAQQQTTKPEYNGSEVWQYRSSEKGFTGATSEALNGTYELIYQQGTVKAYLIDGSAREEVNTRPDFPGENLLLLLGAADRRPDLRFPLTVGQKWDYKYENTPRGARRSETRSVEIAVTGMEQVTTPAGVFNAYKLVKSELWSGSGKNARQNSSSTTYFYSPDTKSIVKSSFESESGGKREIELIKKQ